MPSKKGKSPRGKPSAGKADPAVDKPKNDEVPNSQAHSGSASTITSTGTVTSASTKSRGKRSVICMYKVVVKKALRKKFKVTYNTSGMINRPVRHTLQSYIGMLARTMVPININSWPEVEDDLKDRIWEDIQVMLHICLC